MTTARATTNRLLNRLRSMFNNTGKATLRQQTDQQLEQTFNHLKSSGEGLNRIAICIKYENETHLFLS